jgi:hypothetical protein
LIALAVLIPCLSVLGLAAWLTPNPAGVGTHTQLGLTQCGFRAATDLPCVSCGMTTSFAHAANGNLLTAFGVQPMGALLAIITAMLIWIAAYAGVAGVSLTPIGRLLSDTKMVTALLVLAGAAWAYTLTMHLLGS